MNKNTFMTIFNNDLKYLSSWKFVCPVNAGEIMDTKGTRATETHYIFEKAVYADADGLPYEKHRKLRLISESWINAGGDKKEVAILYTDINDLPCPSNFAVFRPWSDTEALLHLHGIKYGRAVAIDALVSSLLLHNEDLTATANPYANDGVSQYRHITINPNDKLMAKYDLNKTSSLSLIFPISPNVLLDNVVAELRLSTGRFSSTLLASHTLGFEDMFKRLAPAPTKRRKSDELGYEHCSVKSIDELRLDIEHVLL